MVLDWWYEVQGVWDNGGGDQNSGACGWMVIRDDVNLGLGFD